MQGKRTVVLASMLALLTLFSVPLFADQLTFTDFEGFTLATSVNGQNGWGVSGHWDEQVVNDGSGNTVWRVSNASTAGSFGDMPFAPRLGGIPTDTVTNPTNNSPGAFAGESSTGTSLRKFTGTFAFRSATGGPQPGLRITVSADNGQGGRQSFIALEDTGSGIDVTTWDVDAGGNFIGPITIASGLSYKRWHSTTVRILFKDGLSNDVVKYFVDGKRVHTGQSWEQYYRNFQATLHPLGVPVQTLLFRLSGDAAPGVVGHGFYIDNVAIKVSGEAEPDDDD